VRRIPNGLAAVVAVAGAALRTLEGPAAFAATAATSALLFAALFLLFARGWLGGGDVKLATAVALGLPPEAVWPFIVLTALAGGVLSAVYLLAIRARPRRPSPQCRGRSVLRRVLAAECWRVRRRGPLPYGIALCASGVLLIANGQLQG